MQFPKRTETHVIESASWKVLQQAIPPAWIVREVTERDYGIDCYVEVVWHDNQVTGDLCSLQLKGSETIDWEDAASEWGRKARYSGVKKSTVNYWMRLPVPVFLIWAELKTGKMYYVSVKEQVRAQYPAYLDQSQKTMGFVFQSEFCLPEKKGEVCFIAQYFKERSYEQFSWHLTGLLTHYGEYFDFIIENQSRDCFLEVEEERQLLLRHIYDTCHFLSRFLGVEWRVTGLAEAYKSDKESFKAPYCMMHEMTLDRILCQLQPIFIEILDKAKGLVVEEQSDYWKRSNWLLHAMCLNLHTDYMKPKSQ